MLVVRPRIVHLLAGLSLGLGSLFLGGCGSQSSAARAQNPAPPSLSAPIRPDGSDAQVAEGVKLVPADEYAFLKDRQPGTSVPLPPVDTKAAPAPSYATTPAPTASMEGSGERPQYYVMKQGDTLYKIARAYNVQPKELIAANNFSDPNKLSVGTRVRIP
ncbi:MAG: LysM peptidoglycan-binding domain-containing protein [Planctomycetes bacterium]|nr:LysM peptidoglycan-binding domain-containing protein [Planctomycetota bacterium]